jgi:glutamine synthetase
MVRAKLSPLCQNLFGAAGSGMHFHQLLFKDVLNVFYDARGYANLSETALYYVGEFLTTPRLFALSQIPQPTPSSALLQVLKLPPAASLVRAIAMRCPCPQVCH